MGSQPTPSPIRLAILEADTPLPGIRKNYNGNYTGVFTHLFTRALAPTPLSSALTLTGHDVVSDPTSYPDPESIDAVLISGSKHSAYESDDWILRLVTYTKRLLEGGRVRVIGVCFGHQILGRAMGAEVGRNVRGWELSVIPMQMTEEGKRIFGVDELRIQQMHRDQVTDFPPGVTPLCHTDMCPTQGMYIPKRMIAVQGHPEFTGDMVTEILKMRHDNGIIPTGVFEDAMGRVENEHDGVKIAQAFLRFLRE
ncbi:class I glutamine amidotransferase-like protein [Pseudomassariella vexata]|uniref:Class I glutamine amidotransferase-like protein n=1 Tax=Pseudomassariella vexata TaxID=1141098 RepID=A0A1Y2DGB4_9PEZI|nr:class I glutamine amidotransferase-like protein [Pseudomassariella vexata]ORY58124.1 class I glutamine amidotransferase-like protein [Pseudomassariella vexata]